MTPSINIISHRRALFENILDKVKEAVWAEFNRPILKSPEVQIPQIDDNSKWVLTLYKEILKMDVDEKDSGYQYWMNQLSQGMPRDRIENYFRQVAYQDNAKYQQTQFEDLLGKHDRGKRVLYIMPESIGDLFVSTALFKSLKEQYPWATLYVATKPENIEVLDGNPYIDRVIPYTPQMDNQLWLEGIGGHNGFFELSFHPYFSTQKLLNYVNNGKTNIAVDLK